MVNEKNLRGSGTRLFRSKYHTFMLQYIFDCTSFHECRGLDILCGFIFANVK